jgi:hypothetical protein
VTARIAADAVTANLIAQEQVRARVISFNYTLLLADHANSTHRVLHVHCTYNCLLHSVHTALLAALGCV